MPRKIRTENSATAPQTEADVERDLGALMTFGMAREQPVPDEPVTEMQARIALYRETARSIAASGLPPATQIEELREQLDRLGLLDAAEAALDSMRTFRQRWGISAQ